MNTSLSFTTCGLRNPLNANNRVWLLYEIIRARYGPTTKNPFIIAH